MLRKMVRKDGKTKLKFKVKPLKGREILKYCPKCRRTKRFRFVGKDQWKCSCGCIQYRFNHEKEEDLKKIL